MTEQDLIGVIHAFSSFSIKTPASSGSGPLNDDESLVIRASRRCLIEDDIHIVSQFRLLLSCMELNAACKRLVPQFFVYLVHF